MLSGAHKALRLRKYAHHHFGLQLRFNPRFDGPRTHQARRNPPGQLRHRQPHAHHHGGLRGRTEAGGAARAFRRRAGRDQPARWSYRCHGATARHARPSRACAGHRACRFLGRAPEQELLPRQLELSLCEALVLGLLKQGISKYLTIFGHGSTDLGEVLRTYTEAGVTQVYNFRNKVEMAHAGTALAWAWKEPCAVVTSIGPGALQAMAGSLAAACNGVGLYHLYGDETTWGEGYNMQQIPKPQQQRGRAWRTRHHRGLRQPAHGGHLEPAACAVWARLPHPRRRRGGLAAAGRQREGRAGAVGR